MAEVVAAFVFWEGIQELPAEIPESVRDSYCAIAKQLLKFGECQFDWIQIGRIRRQVANFRPHRLDRLTHARNFVAGEIVHHHDVAWLESRRQMLLDPREKEGTIESAVNRERCYETCRSQRTDKGGRLPTPTRSVLRDPHAKRSARIPPCHVRFRPGFVDEDNMAGIDLLLGLPPLRTPLGDVRSVLLGGDERLFFRE